MAVLRAIAVCAWVIAATIAGFGLGQQLLEMRAQQVAGNALSGTAPPTATPAASASALAHRPLLSVSLPDGYSTLSAKISPDGRSLVAMRADYRALAMFELPESGGPALLRGTTSSSGGEWLPDSSGFVVGTYLPATANGPRNADGAIATMKQQAFAIFERGGSLTAIGTGWSQSRASPSSKWIPVIDDCCPSPIRLLDRSGGPARLLIRITAPQDLFILGWGPGDVLLYTQAHRLYAMDLTGKATELVAPNPPATKTPSYSYMSISPDGAAALLQVSGTTGQPSSFALTGAGAVAISAWPYGGHWIGPHEILAATETRFVGVDVLSGRQRELAIPANPRLDVLVGTSAPYLLWADEPRTALHLADARTGGDRKVELGWIPQNSQPVEGGRMLLVSSSLTILDGAEWLATVRSQ